jgi:cytochrome oxidase Cu insertion factor (SCO1/SenC/PrrC family)
MVNMQSARVIATVGAWLIVGAAVVWGQGLTGGEAPAFELPSLDGEQVSLADLRGNYVVLHFGAGW